MKAKYPRGMSRPSRAARRARWAKGRGALIRFMEEVLSVLGLLSPGLSPYGPQDLNRVQNAVGGTIGLSDYLFVEGAVSSAFGKVRDLFARLVGAEELVGDLAVEPLLRETPRRSQFL